MQRKTPSFREYFTRFLKIYLLQPQQAQKKPSPHRIGEKEGVSMDQQVHTSEPYDYRQYDRVWQRVAPTLEPYPGMQPAEGVVPTAISQTRQESQLPGAVQNPCCMGSAASESLEVLSGFIEEELAERRFYLAFSRQAPSWARQQLRELGAEQGNHAQKLMAAYYLITGECYRPNVSCERIYIGRWCPTLRERYHVAACSGLNYARAAEGTTDPCLRELLNELSRAEYLAASRLMTLLERAIRNG